jgi:hypothetical protein
MVTYNGNGGSGAPASQNKISNVPLTLSSATPTEMASPFSTGIRPQITAERHIQSGAFYESNAALTLYAIWTANTYTVTYDRTAAR